MRFAAVVASVLLVAVMSAVPALAQQDAANIGVKLMADAAVKAAVVQVAMAILSNQLAACLRQEIARGGHPEMAVQRFTEVFKKFY